MENTTQPPQQTPDITLADLEIVKNIIDVASQRGAFKASELKDVGEAYNKLSAFIANMVRLRQEAAQAEAESTQGVNAASDTNQGE